MMKHLTNYILAGVSIVLLSSCGDKAPANEVRKSGIATWIAGSWENLTPEGKAVETWEVKSDTSLAGKSYFIQNGDTVSSESLKLEYVNGELCYIPTVRDQNNGQPVTFKLKEKSDTYMAFENPAHDFPQLITYTLINQDSIVAEISGTVNGARNSQAFPMRRVK